MALTLVEAAAQDTPAIAALHAASWRMAYRGIMPDSFLDREVLRSRRHIWAERMRAPRPDQLVIKAVDDGRLCGFACLYLDADPQWGPLLDNLHVLPGLTGQGVGTLLLHDTRARAQQQRGSSTLHLWVFESNTRARQFYDHRGGQPTERRTAEVLPGVFIPELRYVFPALGA